MCVTFCHVRKILLLNHNDCLPEMCLQAPSSVTGYEPCSTCKYRGDEDHGLCMMTMAPLPDGEMGCCHHNAEMIEEVQEMDDRIFIPYDDYVIREKASFQMEATGVPFQHLPDGRIAVDPGETILPEIYGRGVEHD